MVVGINYMVSNFGIKLSPLCFDQSGILLDFITCSACSFCSINSYENYIPTNVPSKNFYSIDIIGNLNDAKFVPVIQKAIRMAWINEYKEITDSSVISTPSISNTFEKRVGGLGASLTRVFYLINIGNREAINGFDRSPRNQLFEVSNKCAVFF
jgi:hypothetical protein